jgi:hypothetical protein
MIVFIAANKNGKGEALPFLSTCVNINYGESFRRQSLLRHVNPASQPPAILYFGELQEPWWIASIAVREPLSWMI